MWRLPNPLDSTMEGAWEEVRKYYVSNEWADSIKWKLIDLHC